MDVMQALRAARNRAHVERLVRERDRELALAVALVDLYWCEVEATVAGFGDLDFEHGARGPFLGSDEVF